MDEKPVAVEEPSFIRRHWWKILLIVLLLLGAALVAGRFRPDAGGATRETEQFIQADFIDLTKIFSISKFRSGSGHDFSQRGEPCRSMKHYFVPQWSEAGQKLREANSNLPPLPDGVTDIAIYSPVDGKIVGVNAERTPIGVQVYIRPEANRRATVRLFHIYLDSSVAEGSKVRAGEKIGVIGQYSSTDIAIQTSDGFVSYFDVMPDSIFAKYQARGVKTRSDLIFTKEYRDANPLQCNGESFAVNYDSDPNSGNFVLLSGYTTDTRTSGSGSN